ncbi:hypothetical protein GCM10027440_27790 [Nocardiopsis coralliicola]
MAGVELPVSPVHRPIAFTRPLDPRPPRLPSTPGSACSAHGHNSDGLLSGMPVGRGPAGLYETTPDCAALSGADGAPPPASARRPAPPDTASCRRRPRAGDHPRPGAAERRAVHRRRGAPRGRVV